MQVINRILFDSCDKKYGHKNPTVKEEQSKIFVGAVGIFCRRRKFLSA